MCVGGGAYVCVCVCGRMVIEFNRNLCKCIYMLMIVKMAHTCTMCRYEIYNLSSD